MVGKTIETVDYSVDSLTIKFTDGTNAIFEVSGDGHSSLEFPESKNY